MRLLEKYRICRDQTDLYIVVWEQVDKRENGGD